MRLATVVSNKTRYIAEISDYTAGYRDLSEHRKSLEKHNIVYT